MRIRAAAIAAPHAPVEIIEIAVPDLARGAALLRTVYSEVCGTDVHLHHGRLSGVPYPLVPGHVSVGRIEAMRGPITDVNGDSLREGHLVTFLDVHETCGACFHCLVAKQTTRCPSRKVYGITYGAADGPLGGWAEQIWMKPGVKMIRLPDRLAPETFIGGGCGLVTALHAVDRAQIALDQSVVVLGLGPVGQSVVALARLSGASEVVAVDAVADRLAYARRMGASATIAIVDHNHEGHETLHEGHEQLHDGHEGLREGREGSQKEHVSRVRELTAGHGADVVIEASGAPSAVSDALDMVRDGGRVVICGHYTDNGAVKIHPHFQVNRKHVEIRGVWGCDYSHFHRAVAIAARHGERFPWRDMVTRSYRLDEAGEALAAVEQRTVMKALIAPNE